MIFIMKIKNAIEIKIYSYRNFWRKGVSFCHQTLKCLIHRFLRGYKVKKKSVHHTNK